MRTNLGLELRQRAELAPGLEAYVEPATDTRLDYRGLNDYANRCAVVLAGLGLRAGNRVALLLQNSSEFVALFYGAAKLGLVVVPLNTRLAALIDLYNRKNMQVIQGYALTETVGGGSFLLDEDAARKVGSAGKPAGKVLKRLLREQFA